MKTKLIVTALVAFGLSSAMARGNCENKLSWRVWESQFHQLLKSKHIKEPRHETTSLRTAYCNGASPAAACEEIGCDVEEFSQVWMPRFNKLRGGPNADKSRREAEEEYFWFEYFLEGISPEKAIRIEHAFKARE